MKLIYMSFVLPMLVVAAMAQAQMQKTSVGALQKMSANGQLNDPRWQAALNDFNAMWNCMPNSLKQKSPIKKENIVLILGVDKSKVEFKCGKPTRMIYGTDDIGDTNSYKAKFVVAEELVHSTQSFMFPSDKPGNNFGAAGLGGIMNATERWGYLEVAARMSAAEIVDPMNDKQPPGTLTPPAGTGGPYPNDAKAKEVYEKWRDEKAFAPAKKALCVGLNQISGAGGQKTVKQSIGGCVFLLCKAQAILKGW